MPSIELDCPPGSPRPGDLIDGVLEGTGLTAGDTGVRFFGCWSWTFDMPIDQWTEKIVPVIKPRIEALYHAGRIRYGAW